MAGVPASSHGSGLPAQWTANAAGGLTIRDTALTSDYGDLLVLSANSGAKSPLQILTSGDTTLVLYEDASSVAVNSQGLDRPGGIMRVREYDVDFYAADGATPIIRISRDGTSMIGFFGHAPAARQTLTSGTATPEQIALALQANGFCGGT